MTDFSADWLALREPADHRSRSVSLTRAALAALPPDCPCGAVDLACGTGSNYRYIEATLKGSRHDEATLNRLRQGSGGPPKRSAEAEGSRHASPRLRWVLIDRDADLLARVPPAANLEIRRLDLAVVDDDLVRGHALVTASALLDLVSDAWLRRLVAQCDDHRAAALFALTYDGRIACDPPEPEDARIRDLVNRHQGTDKGWGAALGPAAAAAAARYFSDAGFAVRREPSAWMLSADDGQLQIELIAGWAAAASALAPGDRESIVHWQARRLAHIAAGRSIIRVGHDDLLALPK